PPSPRTFADGGIRHPGQGPSSVVPGPRNRPRAPAARAATVSCSSERRRAPPSALAWGRSPLNARAHALQKRTANDVKEKSRVRVLLAGFSASLGNARASRLAARPAEGAAAALALVSCCSSQEIAWSCTRTA